jgi:hypothetical protein
MREFGAVVPRYGKRRDEGAAALSAVLSAGRNRYEVQPGSHRGGAVYFLFLFLARLGRPIALHRGPLLRRCRSARPFAPTPGRRSKGYAHVHFSSDEDVDRWVDGRASEEGGLKRGWGRSCWLLAVGSGSHVHGCLADHQPPAPLSSLVSPSPAPTPYHITFSATCLLPPLPPRAVALDGTSLQGRKIRVSYAQPKPGDAA